MARRSGVVKGIRMSSRSTPSMGAVKLTAKNQSPLYRHFKKLSLGLLAVSVGILITTQSNGKIDASIPTLQILSTQTQTQPTFFFNDRDDALAEQRQDQRQDQRQIVRRPINQPAVNATEQVAAGTVATGSIVSPPSQLSAQSVEPESAAPAMVLTFTEPATSNAEPAGQNAAIQFINNDKASTATIVEETVAESADPTGVIKTNPAPKMVLAMNSPTDSAAEILQPHYKAQPQDSEAARPSISVENPFVEGDTIPKTTAVSPLVNHPSIAAIRKQTEFPEGASTETVTVAAGDTLSKLLNDRGVKIEQMPQLLTDDVIKDYLSNLDIGQTFQIVRLANGDFHSLSAKVGDEREISIRRSANGFATASIDLPLEKERVVTSGTIEQSLYVAADQANLKQSTIMELSDIFQWELDFARDIRKGDQFSLIYDRLYRDGKYIGDGDILAAEFVRGGKHYQAIRYTDPDGNTGYYSPDGRSKRRTFLRHPVDVVRITSKFDPNRVHPVLHKIRAHKGVDYGSPTGTPIRATADGVVRFAGSKSAYGKTVILRHGTDIRTLYAHMSRISDKVAKGKRVKQGDVIGYVGATGRVTGAHLHYEFQKNGNHVDPLKVELPAAQPLKAEWRDGLRDLSDDLLAQMRSVLPDSNGPVVTTAAK